jgi:hypothetical protein
VVVVVSSRQLVHPCLVLTAPLMQHAGLCISPSSRGRPTSTRLSGRPAATTMSGVTPSSPGAVPAFSHLIAAPTSHSCMAALVSWRALHVLQRRAHAACCATPPPCLPDPQSLGNMPAATVDTREPSENWKGTYNGGDAVCHGAEKR